MSLPTFSGKGEKWAEFQRYFLELTAEERFSNAVFIAQLREHLSIKEAKALIARKTDPTEALAALNNRYGDKDLALVNITYKLVHLDTSKEEGYEKVKVHIQGVNKGGGHPEGGRSGNRALQRRLSRGPACGEASQLGAGTVASGPDNPGVHDVRGAVPSLVRKTRGSCQLNQADSAGPVSGHASNRTRR